MYSMVSAWSRRVHGGRGRHGEKPERQLGQRRRRHRAEEKVTAQNERAQVGQRARAASSASLHRYLVRGGGLRGVRPVRQHSRPSGVRPGSRLHRRRRRARLARALVFGIRALRRRLLEERRRAEGLLQHRERLLHLRVAQGVLADDPQARPGDARAAHGVEQVQQPPQDALAQRRVRLRDLADEHRDVKRRGGVGVP